MSPLDAADHETNDGPDGEKHSVTDLLFARLLVSHAFNAGLPALFIAPFFPLVGRRINILNFVSHFN